MSIKELLQEAVSLSDNTAITEALNDVFESAQLSEEVRTKFSTILESVVKAKAIELAESHIEACAAEADKIIKSHEADLNESAEQYGEYIAKEMESKLDTYLDHVTETWQDANLIAVQSGLKVNMFDNMVTGLKEMFVENNIVVAEDQVDVVAELTEEIEDLGQKLDTAITENVSHTRFKKAVDKTNAVAAVTANLTESQKEKVSAMAESLEFTDDFTSRLETIVEFAATSTISGALLEAKDKKEVDSDDDKGSENFKSDDETDDDDKKKKKREDEIKESNPMMESYLAASKKLR